MYQPFSIVTALSLSMLTAMFAGMFILLAVILARAFLPRRVVQAGYGSDWLCLRPEREARGLKLLKEWLSPEQQNSYQAYQYFDVTGCDTGQIYRIHLGLQGNVEQIDADSGQAVCRWCFAPEDSVVAGDAMIAQKIALETNERAALKVANRLLPWRLPV